jgi:hypothetical protein
MRRYAFLVQGEDRVDRGPTTVALSDHGAAMLRAVTMCAEIGCNGGFHHGYSVSVRDAQGAGIGRVSVVIARSERRDA